MSGGDYSMSNLRARLKNVFGNPAVRGTVSGVVMIILMLIIPLPAILLDILMVMNLTICVAILLFVIRRKKAAGSSFLPTVLLMVSVFGRFQMERPLSKPWESMSPSLSVSTC